MNQSTTIIVTGLMCCLGIAVLETRKYREKVAIEQVFYPMPTRLVAQSIHAPGRISGSSEDIELHSQVAEPVAIVHVRKGQMVKRGERLVTLNQELLRYEWDLASALVAESKSSLEKLIRGARESELEASRAESDAAKSIAQGAKSRMIRAAQMLEGEAISPQDFEDAKFNAETLQSLASASLNRHRTLSEPARPEDVSAATARLRAAQAKFALAEERLRQSVVTSPVDGIILDITKQVGEFPENATGTPLIVMCQSGRQRAMLEIDEFDVFRVALGQRCEITADGHDGVIAHGIVTEIEPKMRRKEVFGQWAGERNDSFSRRVWVDLDEGITQLPIGLPIRCTIEL